MMNGEWRCSSRVRILAPVLSLVLVWLWWLPRIAHADDFHVDSAFRLQRALDEAADNGRDDIVYLAAGVYDGPFDCAPRDGRALTIRGELGTTADDIFLDGGDSETVFRVMPFLTGDLRLQGLTIQHGRSSSHGGGILIEAWGESELTMEIRESVIRFNQAEKRGGGLKVHTIGGNSNVDLVMVNTLLHGNQAAWTGGGIDATASEVGENNATRVVLVNCTLVENVSDSDNDGAEKGGGLRVRAYGGIGTTASLVMYNTIVHGNSLGIGEAQDVFVDQSGSGRAELNAHHCDIGQVRGDLSLYTPVNVISADPAFFDPESDDYHLRVASPCRDAGTAMVPAVPGLPTSDFEGDPRNIGAAPDIGADEFSPGVHRSLFLPLLLRYPGQ